MYYARLQCCIGASSIADDLIDHRGDARRLPNGYRSPYNTRCSLGPRSRTILTRVADQYSWGSVQRTIQQAINAKSPTGTPVTTLTYLDLPKCLPMRHDCASNKQACLRDSEATTPTKQNNDQDVVEGRHGACCCKSSSVGRASNDDYSSPGEGLVIVCSSMSPSSLKHCPSWLVNFGCGLQTTQTQF